jgi:hypothetical protein
MRPITKIIALALLPLISATISSPATYAQFQGMFDCTSPATNPAVADCTDWNCKCDACTDYLTDKNCRKGNVWYGRCEPQCLARASTSTEPAPSQEPTQTQTTEPTSSIDCASVTQEWHQLNKQIVEATQRLDMIESTYESCQ